ncbi:hypothetical protein DL93DRAFT_2151611 [Clavulina sp. PMI_390]|nr:hypothetical protein DL93DRAFT_2151611 [Clavulina sp. PMI_390]
MIEMGGINGLFKRALNFSLIPIRTKILSRESSELLGQRMIDEYYPITVQSRGLLDINPRYQCLRAGSFCCGGCLNVLFFCLLFVWLLGAGHSLGTKDEGGLFVSNGAI